MAAAKTAIERASWTYRTAYFHGDDPSIVTVRRGFMRFWQGGRGIFPVRKD